MTVSRYIKETCSDSNRQPSAIRFISVFVVVVIMGTWSLVSIFNGEIQPLGYDVAMVVAAVVGGKVMQKREEV